MSSIEVFELTDSQMQTLRMADTHWRSGRYIMMSDKFDLSCAPQKDIQELCKMGLLERVSRRSYTVSALGIHWLYGNSKE